MELRRDQMVGLWRALALVLDYIYAERDMTIKRAAVKSRASHARLGANLFRATEAVCADRAVLASLLSPCPRPPPPPLRLALLSQLSP